MMKKFFLFRIAQNIFAKRNTKPKSIITTNQRWRKTKTWNLSRAI